MRSVDRGVPIDYFLKSAAEKVTIEILDAKGQVVNSLQRRAGEGRREAGGAAVGRGGLPAARGRRAREGRHEPVRVGHAVRQREGLSGHDPVGRQHARPARASGIVPGAADRGRQTKTAVVRHLAQPELPRLTDADLQSSSRSRSRSGTRCRRPTRPSSGSGRSRTSWPTASSSGRRRRRTGSRRRPRCSAERSPRS